MNRFKEVLYISLSCVAISCAPTEPDLVTTVDFASDIKPLLEANCLPCHHTETMFGSLNLESKSAALKPSGNRTLIVPGNPDASLIYTKTDSRHGKREDVMPADGILLDETQRKLLRDWIDQGANWPEGSEGTLAPLNIKPGEA